MSEGQVFPVLPEWAERAHMDAAGYDAAWRQVEADPEGYWRGVARRLDWIKPFTEVKDVSFAARRLPHPLVRRRGAERLGQLPRPAPAGARQRHRHHLGGRRPQGQPQDHLRRGPRRDLPHGQCAEGARRQEGRPGHHLPADDPRGGLRHAGLRPHRRDPFGDLRRLLARLHRRADPGLRQPHRHHRRRGPARRAHRAAEGERRRGADRSART